MDSGWKDAAQFPMHWFGLFEWPRIASITSYAVEVDPHSVGAPPNAITR